MIDLEKTLAAAELELTRLKGQPLVVALALPKWTTIVSVLQLSLRHPDLPEQTKQIARTFVDSVIELVERESPDLAAFMRLGDDPRYDESRLAGPTGKFPQGKLSEDDEGELKLSITHTKGNVVINFGGPVAWLALPAAQALQLAKLIQSHAQKA